jgi:multidrug efflux pump subunit AcrB
MPSREATSRLTSTCSVFVRFHASFERGFEYLRKGYVGLLTMLLTRRIIVPILAILVLSLGTVMFVLVGRDFYPAVDGEG